MFLDYLQMYGAVVVISVCWGVAWFALVSAMLHKNLYVKRFIAFCGYFILAQLVLNTFYLYYPALSNDYLLEAVQFTLHGLVLAALQRRRGEHNLLQTLAAVALGYFFIYTFFSSIQLVFLAPLEWALTSSVTTSVLAVMALYLAALAFSLFMAFLIRRVRFRTYWGSLFSSPAKGALTLAGCVVLMHSYRLVLIFKPEWEQSLAYAISQFVFIAIVALVLLFLAVFESNRARLAAQEAQMREQQAYVQALERIQTEVRAFRHDYQNLLAGLVLQAAQGDVDGLQRQLREKLQYFDDHLAREIRQTTYLANVKHPQVKSLLLVKLAAMQSAGILCELEAVAPVGRLGLEPEDFLRVFGVLLDNAAEAAGAAEKPFVGLVLLQEGEALHLVVKNTFPADQRPDIGGMWQAGRTTKGPGRGFGLASVRAILERYPHAVCRSALEDELFVQQLTVKLGGAG